MAVSHLIEDVLPDEGDEYEEGEILDGDTLYDDVSSLEECSDSETTTCGQKKRRKVHKCKENSVCRKERSGKHCYARILRKDEAKPARPTPELQSASKKDLFEKENRFGKGRSACCSKMNGKEEKKRRVSQPRRKRRAPSPKQFAVGEPAPTNTSLLSRLVGSGSLTMPTTVPEEPKKEEETEIALRMEALRTAVLKKKEERIKNGKPPVKRIRKEAVDDSFVDLVLGGSPESPPQENPTPPPDAEPNLEPTQCLKEINVNKTSGKRKRQSLAMLKKSRRIKTKKKKERKVTSCEEPEEVDEDSLRRLALLSLRRPQAVDLDTPKTPVQDTDLRIRPPVQQEDDIDEDILRAELLSSLSHKIQQKPPSEPKTVKKVGQDSIQIYPKRSTPVVPPFIIQVNRDSDSSDEEPPDVSASIDLLLEQERKKTESKPETPTPPVESLPVENTKEPTPSPKRVAKIKMSPSIPVGLKNLPKWQLEDYRRLRTVSLHKQKVIQAAKLRQINKSKIRKNSILNGIKKVSNPTPSQRKLPAKTEPAETVPQSECLNITKDLEAMDVLIEDLKKEINSLYLTKKAAVTLRKQLALAQNDILKKRTSAERLLQQIKAKESVLSKKIHTELSDTNETNREAQLIVYRFKELQLKSQMAVYSSKANLNGRKIEAPAPQKIPQVEQPKKIFTVANSAGLDPHTPICPFDISGVCKDDECKFQHVRSTC